MGVRRTRGIGLGLCGVAVLGGVLLAACDGGGGPRPLSDTTYWRSRIATPDGVDAVVAQGAAAVPLLKTLLGDANESVVQSAALAVSMIGGPAAATTPDLLDALDRFPNQPFVKDALRDLKGAAVPYLVPLLDDPSAAKKERAVEAVMQMGAAAEPAMDALMRIIEGDAPTDLKRKALVAMGGIGEPAVGMIKRLNEFAIANDELRNDAAKAAKRIRTAKKVRIKGGDR